MIPIMPFGKWKNTPLNRVPLDYLKWIAARSWLREPLKSAVDAILNPPVQSQSAEDQALQQEYQQYLADQQPATRSEWNTGTPIAQGPYGDNLEPGRQALTLYRQEEAKRAYDAEVERRVKEMCAEPLDPEVEQFIQAYRAERERVRRAVLSDRDAIIAELPDPDAVITFGKVHVELPQDDGWVVLVVEDGTFAGHVHWHHSPEGEVFP